MSGVNTTINLWVAVTRGGCVLYYGNPNEHLSYHIASSWDFTFSGRIVNGARRWEIMEHIKKWNKKCGNKKQFKCKAVKVAITVKEIKKGKTNE